MRFGLALIGIGMRGAEQVTKEQLRVLARSKDIVVAASIPDSIWEMLRGFDARLHDAGAIYFEYADRTEVYQKTAEMVLEIAAESGQTSFVQYGHPLVYSRPARLLIEACKHRGISVEILPGISSIDEIFCLLALDIRDRDLQILHAEHFFSKRKQINPEVDLMLMQVGLLGEHDLTPYLELQAHLLRFYPEHHRIQAILLSREADRGHQIVEGTVGTLTAICTRLYGHTLFIEGLGAKEN